MLNQISQTRLRFELQENILSHICRIRDAGYDTLAKDDSIRGEKERKDRATIIQALNPLIKKGYVTKSRERNEERNIEIVFRPTPKGVFYALAFLGLTLDTLINIHQDEDDSSKYAQVLGCIVDPKERDNFIANSAKALLDFDLFNEKGELKITKKQELFNVGLIYGLAGAARTKSPETSVYFERLPKLARILTQKELEEVREFYSNASQLIGKALENFRKEL